MNCLFCHQEMWDDKFTDGLFTRYSCDSIRCMLRNDFPRYICGTDKGGRICWQEYGLGDFYVKVSDYGTRIYKLVAAMLEDEVSISRPMWINPENLDETLDKLKMWVIFS